MRHLPTRASCALMKTRPSSDALQRSASPPHSASASSTHRDDSRDVPERDPDLDRGLAGVLRNVKCYVVPVSSNDPSHSRARYRATKTLQVSGQTTTAVIGGTADSMLVYRIRCT